MMKELEKSWKLQAIIEKEFCVKCIHFSLGFCDYVIINLNREEHEKIVECPFYTEIEMMKMYREEIINN